MLQVHFKLERIDGFTFIVTAVKVCFEDISIGKNGFRHSSASRQSFCQCQPAAH